MSPALRNSTTTRYAICRLRNTNQPKEGGEIHSLFLCILVDILLYVVYTLYIIYDLSF